MRGAACSLVLVLIAVSASVDAGRGWGRGGSSSGVLSGAISNLGEILGRGRDNGEGNAFVYSPRNRDRTYGGCISNTLSFHGSVSSDVSTCIRRYNRECGETGDDECDIRPTNRVPADMGEGGVFNSQRDCEAQGHCWARTGPFMGNQCYLRKTDICAKPKRIRKYVKANTKDECNDGCFDASGAPNERCYLSMDDLCNIEEANRSPITGKGGRELTEDECASANGCYDSKATSGSKCFGKDSTCISVPRTCARTNSEEERCDHSSGVGRMKVQMRCCPINRRSFTNRDNCFDVEMTRPCCLSVYGSVSRLSIGASYSGAPGALLGDYQTLVPPGSNPTIYGYPPSQPTGPGETGAGNGPPGEVDDGDDDDDDDDDNAATPVVNAGKASSTGQVVSAPGTGQAQISVEAETISWEHQPVCSDCWPWCEENGKLEQQIEFKRDCFGRTHDRNNHVLHGSQPNAEWMSTFQTEMTVAGCGVRTRGGCHGEGGHGRAGYVFGRVARMVIRHFKEGGTTCNVLDVLEDMKCCILKRFNIDRERLESVVQKISVDVSARYSGRLDDYDVEIACDHVIEVISCRYDEDIEYGMSIDEPFVDIMEHVPKNDIGYFGLEDIDHEGLGHMIREALPQVLSKLRGRGRVGRCGFMSLLDDLKVSIQATYVIEDDQLQYVFRVIIEHVSERYDINEEGSYEDWSEKITAVISLRKEWSEDVDRVVSGCQRRSNGEVHHTVISSSSSISASSSSRRGRRRGGSSDEDEGRSGNRLSNMMDRFRSRF